MTKTICYRCKQHGISIASTDIVLFFISVHSFHLIKSSEPQMHFIHLIYLFIYFSFILIHFFSQLQYYITQLASLLLLFSFLCVYHFFSAFEYLETKSNKIKPTKQRKGRKKKKNEIIFFSLSIQMIRNRNIRQNFVYESVVQHR